MFSWINNDIDHRARVLGCLLCVHMIPDLT